MENIKCLSVLHPDDGCGCKSQQEPTSKASHTPTPWEYSEKYHPDEIWKGDNMKYSNGREIIDYSPELKIVNTEQLPKGVGAKYLECIRGLNGVLVAKQWRKNVPMQRYQVLVVFE